LQQISLQDHLSFFTVGQLHLHWRSSLEIIIGDHHWRSSLEIIIGDLSFPSHATLVAQEGLLSFGSKTTVSRLYDCHLTHLTVDQPVKSGSLVEPLDLHCFLLSSTSLVLNILRYKILKSEFDLPSPNFLVDAPIGCRVIDLRDRLVVSISLETTFFQGVTTAFFAKVTSCAS
jgi:hypothetical protein